MQNFLVKQQITQVTQAPYHPGLAPCNFWLFPKLKSSLKGKRFQTIDEIQENTMGQLMAIGRTMRSQGAYFKGDRSIIVLCTVFFVSCIFLNKCPYFSYCMAGYLLDRPCIYQILFIHHLMIEIWVVFTFWLCNSASVNICTHVFVWIPVLIPNCFNISE